METAQNGLRWDETGQGGTGRNGQGGTKRDWTGRNEAICNF